MIHIAKTSEKRLQQDSIVEAVFMIAGPAPPAEQGEAPRRFSSGALSLVSLRNYSPGPALTPNNSGNKSSSMQASPRDVCYRLLTLATLLPCMDLV